ncbi:hypothetical protein LXL04_002603 [Taraxacum kok-saghyz]
MYNVDTFTGLVVELSINGGLSAFLSLNFFEQNKKELWKLFQFLFLFLALVFAAQVHSTRLQCRCWVPIGILSLSHLIFSVIDRLKWDLGLPNDYTQTVVPQFPNYFQVDSSGDELELVCWSDKLALSGGEEAQIWLGIH